MTFNQSADLHIFAVDLESRVALSVGGQLVIQHNDESRVAKLEGADRFYDMVFHDQHNVWVLNGISVKNGRYELLKLVMKQ